MVNNGINFSVFWLSNRRNSFIHAFLPETRGLEGEGGAVAEEHRLRVALGARLLRVAPARHDARSCDSTYERRSVTGRIMVLVIGKESRVEKGLRRDQHASNAADAQRE